MTYQPTWESVRTHEVPDWYHDAKLGVFLHWGPYSVPAWAPQVPDVPTILREHSPRWLLRNNPYAEWYLNTMQLEGSPTQLHHAETYGADSPYDRFAEVFDGASADADVDAIAALCKRAGARYVALTTKHHDGFRLWPTSARHPSKGAYHSTRDLVGEATEAVRAAGMRMGLNHLPALFADYYNAVPDGVVNDRWAQNRVGGKARPRLVRAVCSTIEALWRFVPSRYKQLDVTQRVPHVDVRTPEYAQRADIADGKWEATRGVGHSFGANRHERREDIVTATGLVRTFIDVVSKNGNLLIGIGPEPDGSIPEWQAAPLLGLGDWLAVNGDAIFGTRPWIVAESSTSDGTPVRFTRHGETLYAVLLGTPPSRRVELPRLDASDVESVDVLGLDAVRHQVDSDRQLSIELPERLPVSPAMAIRLQPMPTLTGP